MATFPALSLVATKSEGDAPLEVLTDGIRGAVGGEPDFPFSRFRAESELPAVNEVELTDDADQRRHLLERPLLLVDDFHLHASEIAPEAAHVFIPFRHCLLFGFCGVFGGVGRNSVRFADPLDVGSGPKMFFIATGHDLEPCPGEIVFINFGIRKEVEMRRTPFLELKEPERADPAVQHPLADQLQMLLDLLAVTGELSGICESDHRHEAGHIARRLYHVEAGATGQFGDVLPSATDPLSGALGVRGFLANLYV